MEKLSRTEREAVIKIAKEDATLEWCADLFNAVNNITSDIKDLSPADKILLAIQQAYTYGYGEAVSMCKEAMSGATQ